MRKGEGEKLSERKEVKERWKKTEKRQGSGVKVRMRKWRKRVEGRKCKRKKEIERER